MFKFGLYGLLGLGLLFIFWFYPKYSMIKENPGVCVKLFGSIYYCGDGKDIDSALDKNSVSRKLIIPDKK